MMAGMITLILTGLLRVLRTHRALVLENLALRHQLAVIQRAVPRPRLRRSDRLFWVLVTSEYSAGPRPIHRARWGTVRSTHDGRCLPVASAARDPRRMGQSPPTTRHRVPHGGEPGPQ